MSESSTLSSLFETPRTIIDQTIETNETINRQGLDLTRQAVKPLVSVAPGAGRDAEDQVDDAFDRLDDAQSDLLGEVQSVADRTVDSTEDAAQWSVDVLDRQVGRMQEAGESAADAAEDAVDAAENTVEDAAESAEDTAEDVADATEEATDEAADAVQDAAESANDAAEEAIDDLQTEFDEATDEVDAFDSVDRSATEGLVADDIETVSDLATAQVDAVADAASTTQNRAEEWIDAAVDYEGESLADLEGIGETYSDRLAAAGVRTVDQLARTSAAEVADVAEVDEDRAAEWVQQAQDAA